MYYYYYYFYYKVWKQSSCLQSLDSDIYIYIYIYIYTHIYIYILFPSSFTRCLLVSRIFGHEFFAAADVRVQRTRLGKLQNFIPKYKIISHLPDSTLQNRNLLKWKINNLTLANSNGVKPAYPYLIILRRYSVHCLH